MPGLNNIVYILDSSNNLQSNLSVNAPEFVPRKVCTDDQLLYVIHLNIL